MLEALKCIHENLKITSRATVLHHENYFYVPYNNIPFSSS